MADPLRINAVELLRQPGAVRTIAVDVDPGSIEAQHERLTGDLRVDLRLEALNDGITVIGTVSAPWATECRRCLAVVSGVAVVPVDELYQVQPLDEEAYLIEDGQLDLVPLVRETALIELDLERLCRDDCAGLCPVCGIDRNEALCDCDTSISDDRWAALEGFVPDDD
jgi:uncharacterized protein